MKVSHLAPALVLSLAFGLSATPAIAQHGGGHGGGGGSHGGGHAYGGGGHAYSGGGSYHAGGAHYSSSGSYHGGGHYYGSGNAVPRGGGGYAPAGGVAGARHPVAGTGHGSYYHGGYYGGHYHYPYYGYGYYPYYYGSPYFYGSFYFGYPYSYYYGWPGYYGTPSYTMNYYSTPPQGEDQGGESAPPAEDYSGSPNTGEIDRDSGQLRLEVRPEDTSVYVDDRFCGTAREARGLKLPPGRHQVELVRPGFATEHREIDVVTGQRAELNVEMQRRH